MATKKSTTKKAPAKVNASAGAPTVEEAINNNELVAEAAINFIVPTDVEPTISKKERVVSADVVVINTSYNPICLTTWERGNKSITIAPKELKRIPRDLYRDLIKNKMIRTWFDKGILATKEGAEETSANEAEVPVELMNPVERTDGQSSVSATVKKFQKDSPIKIQL